VRAMTEDSRLFAICCGIAFVFMMMFALVLLNNYMTDGYTLCLQRASTHVLNASSTAVCDGYKPMWGTP
jgi:hypothetical protein